MPQFSIIIPLFNAQNFIARALKSCVNQSLKDIEIIVIDDKSEDEGLKIALEFAKKDKRIKVFQNDKNLGTFASRNLGVLQASGDFVIFLDSDDFLDLRICTIVLEKMKQGFDLLCFDAFVHRVKTKQFYRFKKDEIFNQKQFLDFLTKQRHFCWSVWAKCFKRDLILKSFEKIDIYEKLSYGEDIFFCYVNFFLCEKIGILKQSLYHYEFNENGRYENKNNKILLQNYKDKKHSIKLMKELSLAFGNEIFHEKLFVVLDKEIKDLKKRLK